MRRLFVFLGLLCALSAAPVVTAKAPVDVMRRVRACARFTEGNRADACVFNPPPYAMFLDTAPASSVPLASRIRIVTVMGPVVEALAR